MAERAPAADADVRFPGFKKGITSTAELTASEDRQNSNKNVAFVTTPTNPGIIGDSPSPKYYSPMGPVGGTGAIPKEKRIKNRTKTRTQIPTIEQELMQITGQREENKSSSSEEESDSDQEIKTYTYTPNKTVLNFGVPEYTLVQPKKKPKKDGRQISGI